MMFSSRLFVLEFLILFDTGATYIRVVDRSYIFTLPDTTSDNTRTQYAADDWCKANGTQLMEIPNSDAQNVTVGFIVGYYKKGLLSGWNTITNGKMNGRGWKWVNGREINSISVEQQGQDPSKSFGFLQSTGNRFLIFASLATDKRGYICEGGSFCSKEGESFNGRCYKSYNDTMSWFEARNQCLSGGGDLASFDFILDNQGLVVLNRTWITSSYTYWIGIRQLLWMWRGSNTEIKYSQWFDGQPVYSSNSQCVCLIPYTWKWIMCECNAAYQFICLSESFSTTTATTSYSTVSETNSSSGVPSVPKPTSMESPASSRSTESSIATKTGNGPNQALAIGLGVGLGGGFLIIAVSVTIYFLIRRKGCLRTSQSRKQMEPSDAIILQSTADSNYAEIQRWPGNGNSSPPDGQDFEFRSPVEYAPLTIVTSVTTPRDMNYNSSSSLRHAKTATLAPPDLQILPSLSVSKDSDLYGNIIN